MGDYATSTDVKTFLRTAKDIIRLGDASTDDLNSTDLDFFIDMAESDINGMIYSVGTPLACTNSVVEKFMRNLTVYRTAYVLYDSLSRGSAKDRPVAVSDWQKKSDEMIDLINNKEMALIGESLVQTARPYTPTRTAIFDGIGINQGNSQFNDDVLDNESDGDRI